MGPAQPYKSTTTWRHRRQWADDSLEIDRDVTLAMTKLDIFMPLASESICTDHEYLVTADLITRVSEKCWRAVLYVTFRPVELRIWLHIDITILLGSNVPLTMR